MLKICRVPRADVWPARLRRVLRVVDKLSRALVARGLLIRLLFLFVFFWPFLFILHFIRFLLLLFFPIFSFPLSFFLLSYIPPAWVMEHGVMI